MSAAGTRKGDVVVVDFAVLQRAAVIIYGHTRAGDVGGSARYGGVVGGDFAVAQGAVLADIGRPAFTHIVHGTAPDGEPVEKGWSVGSEVLALVQHAAGVAPVEGRDVGRIAVVEVKIGSFVAVETAIRPNIALDFKAVGTGRVASVCSFLHINERGYIRIGVRCVHSLLQFHSVLPRFSAVRTGARGSDIDNLAYGQVQGNQAVALFIHIEAVGVSTLFANRSAVKVVAVAFIHNGIKGALQGTAIITTK